MTVHRAKDLSAISDSRYSKDRHIDAVWMTALYSQELNKEVEREDSLQGCKLPNSQ